MTRPTKKKPPLIKREVLARVGKADDLEVHVSKATLDGVTVFDIRDYVPSTKSYGRGVTLPYDPRTEHVLNAVMSDA